MTEQNPAYYRVDVKTFQSVVSLMQETVNCSLRNAPLNVLSVGRAEALLDILYRCQPEGPPRC